MEKAKLIEKTMTDAGFDVTAMEMYISSRESVQGLLAEAKKYGEIAMLVNAAGEYQRHPSWVSDSKTL